MKWANVRVEAEVIMQVSDTGEVTREQAQDAIINASKRGWWVGVYSPKVVAMRPEMDDDAGKVKLNEAHDGA